MAFQDPQFRPGDSDEVMAKKLRLLVEEIVRLSQTVASLKQQITALENAP